MKRPGFFAVAALALFLAPCVRADGIVTIQPIEICDNGGLNCANPGQQLFLAAGNKIWAQAAITLQFLPFAVLDSTTYYNNLTVQTGSMLFNSLIAGGNGASSNPNVINMWFAHSLDGDPGFFGVTSAVGGGSIAIGSDAVLSFNGGVGRIDTLAHEIGHALGLDHTTFGAGGADNLMTAGSSRTVPGSTADINPDGLKLDKLLAAQITVADASPFVTQVPEPASVILLITGIGSLIAFRSRRTA